MRSIDAVFYDASCIDEDFYEELEEILIMGDIGINATQAILDKLRVEIKANLLTNPADCKELLIKSIKEQMRVEETAYAFEEQALPGALVELYLR